VAPNHTWTLCSHKLKQALEIKEAAIEDLANIIASCDAFSA
jgi:hypothetical protein